MLTKNKCGKENNSIYRVVGATSSDKIHGRSDYQNSCLQHKIEYLKFIILCLAKVLGFVTSLLSINFVWLNFYTNNIFLILITILFVPSWKNINKRGKPLPTDHSSHTA